MTNLNIYSPAASRNDLLTCNNAGSGLDNTLQTICDGQGTASVLRLSRTAMEITGPLTLASSLTPFVSATAPGNPTEGMSYYSTVTHAQMIYSQGEWKALAYAP